MAQECGFFNAQLVGEGEYDRVYLAEQFAAYFASFIGNGVFGKSMQKLEVLAQTNPDMSVKVLPGEAWINGWWYRNTEEYTLSLDVADGVLHRIDAIVLRWGNQERDMWLHVIKGIASSNPVAPNIKRDADYYDLQLATVTVSRGAIKITQSSINDTRLVTSVCGLVTGAVDQIDTTDLYNQFEQYFKEFKEYYEKDYANWTEEQKQSYITWINTQRSDYESWSNEQRAEFDQWYASNTATWQNQFTVWFNNIKGQLSEDAAGNLQNQIDTLNGSPSETWADGETIVVDNQKLRMNRIYEEHVTEASLEEYPSGEKYIDMNTYVEPGFYKIDAFDSNVVKNNFPFETGFVLIVRSGGLYNILEPNDGNVLYQEAITNNGRKYRFGNSTGSWGTWRTEGEIDGYAEVVNSASGTNIVFAANISAPKFNGTATKAALLSTQNVNKDANTSVFTGSTVVEEYSASGSSNLPGDGDYVVMTMCGKSNAKAASLAISEEDGRLCTRGRSNGWKDWNRYIHEADIARKRLFNGSLDVGGGVQTLEDDITQYKTIGFMCARGDQYCHGTMFFGYNTGNKHAIPVGKGYITVTSVSGTQIELLENTTGYALRQIWGSKV